MKRSPAAALWLSLIPGAGHAYVGQSSKGVLLILLVASTVQIVGSGAGGFWILFPFLWLYAMLDAYHGAQTFNRIVEAGGEPPRNTSFALSKWWGFLLIGLGVVFTLDNVGILDLDDIAMLWPLALIALGVYILRRQSGTDPPRAPEAPRETEDKEVTENA